MRILIADDEKEVGFLFNAFLRYEFPNSKIAMVANGSEAIDAFRPGNFDILLLDLLMPVIDGYQACLEIQEICRQEKLKMPFVVFCTGLTIPQEINTLITDRTHYALLQKPVTYEKIKSTFKSIIDTLALPCPECGKQISQKDPVCRNCGAPCIVYARNANSKPLELNIPANITADPDAIEVARIWTSNGKQTVTLRPETWKNPEAWSLMLADFVKQIARAYEQAGHGPKEEVLKRIKRDLDVEHDLPEGNPKWDIQG